jgi:Rad3-related DNA helicase
MNILDYFPKGYEPSEIQRKVLTELQHRWNSSSVFVLNLDVASGKSFIAHTVAKWREAVETKASRGARICTPTTVLVDQYAKDFDTPIIKSAGHYTCEIRQTRCGAYKSKDRCRGCVYNKALDVAKKSPVSISTYHMNMVLKHYRGTMIFDEAHKLPTSIRDIHSGKVFCHKMGLPPECIGNMELTYAHVKTQDLSSLPKSARTLLELFIKDFESDAPLHFYNWSTAVWSNGGEAYGEKFERSYERVELPTLVAQPLDIFTKPPIFWKDNQKLVLMSATIGRPDLYELGLDKTKPIFIEGASPISPDFRPIYKDYIGSINHQNKEAMMEPLVNKVLEYLENKKGKGVIHITYGLAEMLKSRLKHDRLITHNRTNMRENLKKFLASDNGVYLVSGMYEGVSLDYDKADWQVITKIAWPSLQDPLQKYRSKEDPDYYLWSTLKTVIQTAGRVSRRPDDYGSTHILDESFERLLKEGKHLLPKAFKDRVIES